MVVEGDLDIGYDNKRDTWVQGEVFLVGAKVAGAACLGGGHYFHSKVEPMGWGVDLKKAIDLTGADVKGELNLGYGFEAHGAVILFNAFMGQLDLIGGHFINPDNIALDASTAMIAHDVDALPLPGLASPFNGLKGGGGVGTGPAFEADGVVKFVTAHVGSNVVFQNARFEGKPGEKHGLDAGGILVQNALVWQNVTLENGAILILSGAAIGGLLDDEKSWPAPGKLIIDDFRYVTFGPDSPWSATTRLRWLGLQPTFRSQPYVHLAQVLRDHGDEARCAFRPRPTK